MGEKQTKKDSPLLEQYYQIKSQHPEAILLYRVGDFYETFGEDAVTTSKILGIVLTRKMCGGGAYTPLAGIPCHAVDNYLPKLVRAGYKVAICDQLEDKTSRKLVKRGITELVTPGVSYNDSLLDNKENNFLASVAFGSGSRGEQMCGVAFLDISTGTFKVAEGDLDYLELLLSDFDPKEIIMERSYIEGFRSRFATKACITPFDEWAFNASACRQKLIDRLGTGSLKGFGIEALTLGISAAGAAIHYLEVTYHGEQGHLRTISRIDRDDYVWMDRFTVRNLEIFSPLSGDGGVSLLNILDRCKTPMGARLLREWLALPLQNIEKINGRLNAVSALIGSGDTLGDIQERLSDIGDMERIVSKAASGRILPRELLQLSRGLKKIAEIGKISSQLNIKEAVPPFRNCSGLASGIGRTLLPDAASQLGKGPVIAPGVSAELDHLRGTLAHGKEILLDIQQRERDNTGITSLKVSYNNVFGYFFEVSNRFREMVPKNWIRKQTLVSAERYITEELKRYEETILGAEEKILALEQQHFAELVRMVQEEIPDLQHNAAATARLDTLCSFAETALERNYCRPEVDLENRIHIEAGRHPVIETLMPPGEHYVANCLRMECDDNQIMILTGPNMAGKSAFLRQSALIVLMAHVGSFVPATAAKIGLTDKIFTRVGASDNISRGESTFMVEMNETATILNNLTDRSLVLMDEIGRGTSTFDGMSIAWAIATFLHGERGGGNNPKAPRPKTLFATHYHELNELENLYRRIHNWHISVKEADGKVIFLRKLTPGGVAHSFGIHVARMAGMPPEVVRMAETKLKELESQGGGKKGAQERSKPIQLSLFQLDDPLLTDIKEQLKKCDLNSMSPLDAFDLIRELKRKIGLQK